MNTMKNPSQVKDETGKKYSRLTVLSYDGADKFGNAKWLCLCDCGNHKSVVGMSLRKSLVQSCGCYRKEKSAQTLANMNFRHGLSRTKAYKTHYATKHMVAKRKQMPAWADEQKIKDIYANRPDGYHVDHIIPLQGELVSGLHVENNLQYLTPKENFSKHNHNEVI